MRILNKVEVDLTDYVIEDLNDIEKANLKKIIKKQVKKKDYSFHRFKKQCRVACLVLGALGIGSGVVLAGTNVLGYDFEYLFGVDKDVFKDYKTVINEAVYDKGVHVKLNEVMMDNTDLIINATFQFDEPPSKDEHVFLRPQTKIYINGKQLNSGSHGSVQKVTDTQYIYNRGHSINTEELPNSNMHVKIVFSNIRAGDEVFRGKWEFEFDTNREQLLIDLEKYDIDRSFTIEEEQQVDLLNVELTKIATVINFKMNHTKYEVEFKVEDDLGNKYHLNSLSISHGVENIGYQRFEALNPNATRLIITPYFAPKPESSGKGPDLEDYTLLTEQQVIIDLKR